jgi:hypothetical protein
MREATRTIHNRSDALVNAKLGFTLTDDAVWAEGETSGYLKIFFGWNGGFFY